MILSEIVELGGHDDTDKFLTAHLKLLKSSGVPDNRTHGGRRELPWLWRPPSPHLILILSRGCTAVIKCVPDNRLVLLL